MVIKTDIECAIKKEINTISFFIKNIKALSIFSIINLKETHRATLAFCQKF